MIMELENLKELWGSDVSVKETNEEQLQQMLRQKSKSPIAKMKRNLLMELFAIIVLYVFVVTYYFISFKGGMLSIAWMMIVVGLLYVVYYYNKQKLLNKMECVTCEVKSNLSLQLQTLEKYVRFYLISGTALVPVAMIFTGMITFFYSPEVAKANIKDPSFFWITLGVIVFFALILTIPLYFLNKWYVNKLYGQHVKKLKQILNEME
jgi:hypothetical protein